MLKNDTDLRGLAAEFRQALRGSVFMIRRLDAGSDLSAAQLTILNMVAETGVRVSTIAANLGVKTPSATEAIKKLEGAGYLQRQMDPADSRGVLVTLTEGGRQAAERSNQRRDELIAEILTGLNLREQETLRKALPIITELSSNFNDSH